MLREQAKIVNGLHRSLDLVLTSFCFIAAYIIKKNLPWGIGGLSTDPDYRMVMLLILVIWYLIFEINNNYSSFRQKRLATIIVDLHRSLVLCLITFSFFIYFLKIEDLSRGLILIFFVINSLVLTCSKTGIYMFLSRIRKKGYNHRNILVVGSRTRAEVFVKSVLAQKDKGYKIIGCIETDESLIGETVFQGIKVIAQIKDLEKILQKEIIDELVFAMPLNMIEKCDLYIAVAEDMGVKCRIIPDWQIHYLIYKPDIATIRFESFLGTPTMALHMITNNDKYFVYKSLLDYTLSTIGFLLLLPLFFTVSVLIKLFSRGPVFYKQKRVGLNGRLFYVYKFRTMINGADKMLDDLESLNEADGPAFKITKDPRVIPFVGTLLRKTSLDELPQLINVLKGEMSLVGPRPPLPWEVEKYEIWQRRRLSMKPGITCIWQISPSRNDIKFDEWMKMDLEYIDNWSLWLDFKLVFKTIKSVLTGAGR